MTQPGPQRESTDRLARRNSWLGKKRVRDAKSPPAKARLEGLDLHVSRMPGTRPRWWWETEAPEPRRYMDADSESMEDDCPFDRAVYEAECDYLHRLGLLREGELERFQERVASDHGSYWEYGSDYSGICIRKSAALLSDAVRP